MEITRRSGCPINAAVEVLGDPWATLVLRDIMFSNRRHFRELIAGSEEGIATNILASRLKQLVAAGLLTRDDARRGQRAAYSLTEAGIQVLPVMVALGNWGLAHRHGERRLRVRAELLRDGGPELVAAMIDELRELHLGIPRPDSDAPPRAFSCAPPTRPRCSTRRAAKSSRDDRLPNSSPTASLGARFHRAGPGPPPTSEVPLEDRAEVAWRGTRRQRSAVRAASSGCF